MQKSGGLQTILICFLVVIISLRDVHVWWHCGEMEELRGKNRIGSDRVAMYGPFYGRKRGLYDHFCEFLRKTAMCYYCRSLAS